MKHLKLFFALFAMLALGVGNAWGATYKLTKVTSVSAGEKYVFEQGGYVMNNSVSSNALQCTSTYNTTGLAGTESYVWTLESATGGFYMKNVSKSSSQYLNNSSSTTVSFGSKTSIWKFTFTEGIALIQNTSNSSRFLGWTTTTSHVYKAYATSNISKPDYPHDITVYKLEVEAAPSHTITAVSNNDSWGTVSLNGATITAEPKAGYCVSTSTPYEVKSGTATVTQNGNAFTVDASSDCTIQINFEALPKYTVTWIVNGDTKETQTYTSGDALKLPSYTPTSADCDDVKKYAGWTATAIDGVSETKPTDLFTAASGAVTSSAIYYAVFEGQTGEGATSTIEDLLERSTTGATGSNYVTWSGKTASSSAVYAGQSAGSNSSIQLKSKDNSSGVITTTSGGKAKKVSVVWNTNTSSGRTLDIYGKNTAYDSAADLYNSDAATKGTKIGSIVYGTSTELTIDGDYEYIGIRSNSGALYLTSITITWETGGPTKNYATTCEAVTVKAPTFSVEEGEFSQAFSLTLTQENGKDIYYRLNDDATFTKYTATISIPAATTTVHAYAKDGENESATVSVTYTYIKPIETLAELKAKGAGTYDFTLTDAVVTYVKSDNKKVYIEDATTGMYIYNVTTHELEAGKKYTGSMSGTLYVYNKLNELTAFTLGSDVTAHTAEIPVTELTIAELLANFARYESVRVKVTGTVSAFESRKATLTDGGSSIQLYDDNSLSLSTTANDIVTVVGYPGLYNSEKQLKIMTAEDVQKQEVEKYTVTGTVNPAEAGSVSIATAELAATQTTTVTATANTGYTFASWSVSGTGATLSSTTTNPTTLTMGSEDATITANFTAIPQVKLKLSENGNVSSIGTFYAGETVTIGNVTPCTGNVFVGWTNAVIATPQPAAPAELHKGSYTIPSDATGEITLYAVYAQGGEATETLKYVSDASVYMNGTNEADKVGLDNTKWSVVGNAGGNTNKPYLHKDDEIRLYWTSGKVNTLTISSLVGSTINRIEVTYKTSDGSEVVVGGNVVAGTATGTSNEYAYPINASSFVVRPSSAQIQVKQIEMVVSTYSNYSTTCTENTDEVAVTGVTLLPAQLSLEKDQTSTLTASIAPSNATNQNLTWTSNKESVATVDNGVVTAVAAGKATITVTTEDGEFTATCVVTVTEPTAPVEGVYYELTELANVKSTDEVLYVAKVGEKYYAMSSDGAGSKGQPTAVEVSVVDDKITTDATNVQWNVAKLNDNIETLTFYSVGQSKWLYCINDNNGLRLGTGTTATESNTFKVANGYLCNNKQTRYIGVYNQQDWRSYTGTSTNINDQTFGFYVKHSTLPIITVAPATHDFGLVEVNQSASVTLTIMSENVTALNASITNTTDYSISAITNAADGNKQIIVTYTPTNGNTHEATLTIASATVGEEASFDVTLSGQGMVTKNSIWTLVENVNELQVGDQIVIAAAEYDYALSTNQKTNNRDAVSIINNGDKTIKIHSLVQTITLEEGIISDTWSFNVGGKYLYADGTDANLLKSKAEKDANGSWKVSITDGKASVLGQGGNARETMLYNDNNKIFSCYEDGTKGKALCIYKKNHVKVSGELNSDQIINSSDVTVLENGTLIVNNDIKIENLYIKTTMGTTNTSGQISGATLENLTINGDAFIDITLGKNGYSKQWHAFTVPFPVDAMNGVYDLNDNQLKNEVNYAIMDYHGDIRANGQYGWKKYRGILVPCTFYLMTVDGARTTYRFKKVKDAELIAPATKELKAYTGTGESTDLGWNGVGNPTLMHGKVAAAAQILDPETYTYKTITASSAHFTVGTPFFIQAATDGTMTMVAETSASLAPARHAATAVENIKVMLGNSDYTDYLYVSASEDATNEYEIGKDLAKMTMTKTPSVPQIFAEAYNTSLCMIDAPMANNEAVVALNLYAPAEGEYTISTDLQENAIVYLMQEGTIVWNLSMGEYPITLKQGDNAGYSLLVRRADAPTSVETIEGANNQTEKLIHNGNLYILHNGKVFDAVGSLLK